MFCTGEWFTITISEAPSVLDTDTGDIKRADVMRAKEWVCMNREALCAFGEMKLMHMMLDWSRCSKDRKVAGNRLFIPELQ